MELEHRHGKSRVRVARQWRVCGDLRVLVEWNVSIALFSDCLPSFTLADNSAIVATDSIKNTVYVKAKECKEIVSAEEFGIILGRHFVSTYKEVTGALVTIVENPWDRVKVNGEEHEHGYKLGSEKHTAEIAVDKHCKVKVSSGIDGLSLLKATQSGFEGFIRDKYTLLPEAQDRILATKLKATWRYSSQPSSYSKVYQGIKDTLVETFFGPPHGGVYSPSVQNTLYLMAQAALQKFTEIESIRISMPNLHFLPVNMPAIGVKFEHDVYLPTDEPHGSIEACLTRQSSHFPSKL